MMVAENTKYKLSALGYYVSKVGDRTETIMSIHIVVVILPGALLAHNFFHGLEFELANIAEEGHCHLVLRSTAKRSSLLGEHFVA
jgi:hypothetical protein